MAVKQLIYCLLSIVLLSSCAHLKTVTSDNNSSVSKSPKKSNADNVTFLDVSGSPGHVAASRRSTSPSVGYKQRKQQRDTYNANIRTLASSLNIERADWLQLKYAIVLDVTVETLSNVGLLKMIDEWWGTSYCMGGNTKDCVDCSAFTQMIMQNVYNVTVPRTAQEQYNSSQQINLEDLNEGDLVFFNTSSNRDITHVGIYLLNNKFVHAASSVGVMVSDLNDTYWRPRYRGAGRYVTPPPPATISYKTEGQ